VLRAGEDILWIPGLALDQRFVNREKGRKPIYINIKTTGG
jgi:hypothetical protein